MITELTVKRNPYDKRLMKRRTDYRSKQVHIKEKSLKSIQPDMDHEKITDLLIKNAIENIDEATRMEVCCSKALFT